jgi:hypothetical protein
MRSLLVSSVTLALLCGCDITFLRKSDAGADGAGSAVTTCTGQQTVCPTVPYGLCVEVQQGLGHCVDWRYVGASPCTSGPADCHASLPTGSFTGSPSNSFALCIKATAADLPTSLPSAGAGTCAAQQAAIDPTGQSTCTPNPCGANGYCSYIVNQVGSSVVTCAWPI